VEYQTQEVTADQLKPPDCNGLSLSSYFVNIDGSTTNDLVLGSSGSDALNGNEGNDCIVGGSGDDTLDGGDGMDICIGGDGTDNFSNCETQIDP
jgi:Ca2+-binding RTX toxin-like protein